MEKEILLPHQIILFGDFVKEINKENGRLYKEGVLTKYKDNEDIREILYFIFNDFIVTGIGRSKLEKDISAEPIDIELNSFKELVDFIMANNTGTDAVIKTIQREMNRFMGEYRDLFETIVLRELVLGIGVTSINKMFGKGFIPEFDVMLAEKFHERVDELIDVEVIVTPKLDGNRCVAFVTANGGVELRTRQGLVYTGLEHIEKELSELMPRGLVYDGELIAENTNNLNSGDLYRVTTGLLHRKQADKTPIKFHIFDVLGIDEFQKGKGALSATDRKKFIKDTFATRKDKLKHLIEVPVSYTGVADVKVMDRLLKEATARGEEGIMINVASAPYECKRVKTLLKHKAFNTADVLVLGVSEGSKSFKGTLGQIEVKFVVDGKQYTSLVGSGFSKAERDLYWKNPELLIGKVVEIGYFELSKNEKTGELGLRFPTWKAIIREDKSELSDLNI